MSLKNALRALVVTAAVGLLAACGGGGSKVNNTVVSGVVSKGIFTSGTVNVYAVNSDGTRGALLKTDAIKAGGVYSADLGSTYSGPILVEAFGTYADEATGQSVTIAEGEALKAAVPSASAAPTVVVTPLTDLAVRKVTTGGTIAVSSIAAANTAVAALFGVDNIVSTKPVAFDATSLKGATPAQQKYTEALALVSQYVANSTSATPTATDLQKTLAELSGGITVTGATAQFSSVQVTANLQSAINAALTNDNTKTVLAADPAAKENLLPVAGLGTNKIVKYTLKIEGAAVSNVFAVQTSITLPQAVILADGDTTDSGVVIPGTWFSGLNASAVQAKVLTLGLVSSKAFGDAAFATLYLKVPQATDVPLANAFVLSGTKVTGVDGVTIDGSSVSISEGTAVSVQ